MAITLLRPAGKREKRNALPRSSASGSELGTEAARREGMAEKRAKRTAEGGGSALPVSRADAPELLPNASKREQAAQRLRSAAAQAAEEDRRARLAVYLQRLAESREASKRSAVNALHTARDRDPDLIGAARSNTALRLTDAGTGRDSVPSRWAPPTREGLPFTPSGVVSTGGQAAYDAVAKSDGTVDYTDWEKLTTGQQRERLKRSGLTEGEQWTILNKDESYIRTLGTIADIQRYRSAYGLSAREATELCNALVEIELKKSNAGKEGNPRRSPDYLRYLEEQREKLLHDKGIGGKGEAPGNSEKNDFSLDEAQISDVLTTIAAAQKAISEAKFSDYNKEYASRILSDLPKEKAMLLADEINSRGAKKALSYHGGLQKTMRIVLGEDNNDVATYPVSTVPSRIKPECCRGEEIAAEAGITISNYYYYDGQYYINAKAGEDTIGYAIPIGKMLPAEVKIDFYHPNWEEIQADRAKRTFINTAYFVYCIEEGLLGGLPLSNLLGLSDTIDGTDIWENTPMIEETSVVMDIKVRKKDGDKAPTITERKIFY